MRSVTWNRFPIKQIRLWIHKTSPLWRLVTSCNWWIIPIITCKYVSILKGKCFCDKNSYWKQEISKPNHASINIFHFFLYWKLVFISVLIVDINYEAPAGVVLLFQRFYRRSVYSLLRGDDRHNGFHCCVTTDKFETLLLRKNLWCSSCCCE